MIDLTYSDGLLKHIRGNLGRFDRQIGDRDGLQRAAVAITIVAIREAPDGSEREYAGAWSGQAAVVLTKRSARLRNHAGQWALPGGRMDAGETPEETVLRELEEEVGLRLGAERIVGRLDDYDTRSGFAISPVVVWGTAGAVLEANPDEVASIHRIPVAEFMRHDAPILHSIPESDHPVLMMPVGDNCIAAPTAAILYQFREVAILGRDRRVAHFEQPYFAWR